jgi:hypothetical protein
MYYNINRRIDDFEDRLDLAAGTTSLQMYESIEHWSDSFNIPKHIAYNVAYLETRYQGPFDFDYNHIKHRLLVLWDLCKSLQDGRNHTLENVLLQKNYVITLT